MWTNERNHVVLHLRNAADALILDSLRQTKTKSHVEVAAAYDGWDGCRIEIVEAVALLQVVRWPVATRHSLR